MRHEFAPEAGNVLFSSCRPEAGPTGSADRDRKPITDRAVGRRHRRPFGALLGGSDLNRCGAARGAIGSLPQCISLLGARGCLFPLRAAPLFEHPIHP
jgi:hypothetical protein